LPNVGFSKILQSPILKKPTQGNNPEVDIDVAVATENSNQLQQSKPCFV
jgi:hypothetical protein